MGRNNFKVVTSLYQKAKTKLQILHRSEEEKLIRNSFKSANGSLSRGKNKGISFSCVSISIKNLCCLH